MVIVHFCDVVTFFDALTSPMRKKNKNIVVAPGGAHIFIANDKLN